MKSRVGMLVALAGLLVAGNSFGVTSAEIYTQDGYQFGRFAARIQFAPGSGVVSSFFMWKDGSEKEDVFWNELDFEKLESECRLETNTIYGDPEGLDPEKHALELDLCNAYHVYAYEWTPEYIAWSIDGVEIRRDTGEAAVAFRDNTPEGMQLRFNVWPGDSSFGGDFDPAILPVYEYIDWVEYSSYANGAFQVQWREEFTDTELHSRWLTGSWDSPKGLSTHSDDNVGLKDGYLVLALTSDEATGFVTANPKATDMEPQPQPSTSAPETSAPPATSAASTDTSAAPVAPAPSTTTTTDVGSPMTTSSEGSSCSVARTSAHTNPLAFSIVAAAVALVARGARRFSRRTVVG